MDFALNFYNNSLSNGISEAFISALIAAVFRSDIFHKVRLFFLNLFIANYCIFRGSNFNVIFQKTETKINIVFKFWGHYSMDGKGRATDNIYIERFFRTIKYDYIYLNPMESGLELYEGIRDFIGGYNNRKHQGINYQKPKDLIQFEPNYQLKSA